MRCIYYISIYIISYLYITIKPHLLYIISYEISIIHIFVYFYCVCIYDIAPLFNHIEATQTAFGSTYSPSCLEAHADRPAKKDVPFVPSWFGNGPTWAPKWWFSKGNLLFQGKSGWWFQWFFIFTPILGRFPFWLIFFKWVETTN